jgi:hypothetical protein
MKDGAAIRGGPSLWGAMAENLSGHADCVWRTVYEPAAVPWPWVVASRSAEYVAGDRLNVMPDRGPLNVAEALRLAGVACNRPAPLRWMDEAVPALASEILSAGIENWRETVRADGKLRSVKEKGSRLLYVMDALDRAKLIAHKDQPDFWEAESAASSDGL